MYRIGIGYDLHRFEKGRPLILGGVRIPYAKGLLGHSDADVLLHSISDALLGAISKGDIGDHFPDTDKRYKGADSAGILKKVYAMVRGKGYRVDNVDTIIIMQAPKLAGFKKAIRKKVAGLLHIKEDAVSIKAKTNEGLGPIGKNKAAASYAAVLLKKAVKKHRYKTQRER